MGEKMASNAINIDTVNISNVDSKELFALDTNVLYWTHYSQASVPLLKALPYQVTKYPNFIDKLLDNGNMLITTVLNISELNHVVENSEWRIYKAVNRINIKKKDFRKLSNEREYYKKEMETIMLQLTETYGEQIKVIEITEKDVAEYINNIANNACDIFDFIIISKLKRMGIVNYITDDKDFLTIDGINVYIAQA